MERSALSNRLGYHHALINALGGEMKTYGRWNTSISPDLSNPMTWMANIGLILSPARIEHKNLTYVGQSDGVHLYHLVSRMGSYLQVSPPGGLTGDGIHIDDPRMLHSYKVSKTEDLSDTLEFAVSQSQGSLLILSQKFHRDWRAQVLTRTGWTSTMTVPINGVFQGVLLPGGVEKVRLRFEPYVRYAWIAHIFWGLVLVFILFRVLSSRAKLHPVPVKES